MQPNISRDTEIYLSKYASNSHLHKLTQKEILLLNTLCSDIKRQSPELNKQVIKELEAQIKEKGTLSKDNEIDLFVQR